MNSQLKQSSLAWTGERYLPEIAGHIALEHVHRYSAVLELAAGKRVLDIASGEGYGSDMLALVAHHVIGVDISAEAIQHAQMTYQRPNLEFRLGSADTIPIESNNIDLVVSFETIEHHAYHDEMMLEIKRILTPDGVLVISSPNKKNYSIIPNYSNSYHVKELFTKEFMDLLKNHFLNVKLLGQRVVYGSLLVAEEDETTFVSLTKESNNKGLTNPLYDFAIVTNVVMPQWSNSLFEIPTYGVALVTQLEQQNQLIVEHEKHTRGLNKIILDQTEQFNQILAKNDEFCTELQKILAEKNELNTELQKMLAEKNELNIELQKMLTERDELNTELQKILTERDELNTELRKMQAEKDQLNSELHQTIKAYSEYSVQSKQIIAGCNEEIIRLNEIVIDFTRSTSWYLTKPLRFMSRQSRKFLIFFRLMPMYK